MKISKETLSILKNFTGISNVIYLNNEEGIVVIAPSGSVVGVAETEENMDHGCVFFDWAKFLSIINIMGSEEAELDFQDKFVAIKSQTSGKIKYFYTNPALVAETHKEPKKFSSYQVDFKGDAELEITKDTFDHIRKVSSTMKLDKMEIVVNADGAKIVISDSLNANNSTYEQDIETFSGEATIPLSIDLLNLVPGDYQVIIKNDRAAKFVNKDVPIFYVLGKKKG